MSDNPYDDDLTPIQANIGDLQNNISYDSKMNVIQHGILWDEWIECVQWLSTRYTRGEDSPSEWSQSQIRAMFTDLQYFTYKDIQSALIKLHNEGRTFAPNASQILGMINKLGYKQVMSSAQYEREAKGVYSECKAGGEHNFQDAGWVYDEVGNPVFEEMCMKRPHPDLPACHLIREKTVLSDYNERTKPAPMTREKFIFWAKKLNIKKSLLDEMLELKPRLQEDKDVPSEGEIVESPSKEMDADDVFN